MHGVTPRIEHRGRLIYECSLPCQTRADGLYPGHINAAPLSASRFLLIYSTRGWRGTDDNTSIVYQLREGAYDGPLLAEGVLARSIDDWDALGDGRPHVRGHYHPVVFGVPAGAGADPTGAAAANPAAGHFVAMWGRHARYVDPRTGLMQDNDRRTHLRTGAVEWAQFRLRGDGADIELTAPPTVLRQQGYDSGYLLCSTDARSMHQTYTPPIPYTESADTESADEWVGFNTFDGGRIGALRFRFEPSKRVYEWVESGPLIGSGLMEPSVSRWRDGWVVSARSVRANRDERGGPVGWTRWDDPFGAPVPELVWPGEPNTKSPLTSFRCADGALRLLTGDPAVSPYGHQRNPLYWWPIDPASGFRAGAPQAVFDAVAARVPFREQARFVVDQAKVLPHTGGSRQIIAHRVRPVATNDPAKVGVPVLPVEQQAAGIYYAEAIFPESLPAQWQHLGT